MLYFRLARIIPRDDVDEERWLHPSQQGAQDSQQLSSSAVRRGKSCQSWLPVKRKQTNCRSNLHHHPRNNAEEESKAGMFYSVLQSIVSSYFYPTYFVCWLCQLHYYYLRSKTILQTSHLRRKITQQPFSISVFPPRNLMPESSCVDCANTRASLFNIESLIAQLLCNWSPGICIWGLFTSKI